MTHPTEGGAEWRLIVGFGLVVLGLVIGSRAGAAFADEGASVASIGKALSGLVISIGGFWLAKTAPTDRSQHSEEVNFPRSRRDVYEAVIRAVDRIDGMQVVSSDLEEGRVTIKARMTWKSWGEQIITHVRHSGNDATVVACSSNSSVKQTLWDWGKNRDNVSQLIEATDRELA